MSHRELATADPVQTNTVMSVIAEQQGCDEAGRDHVILADLLIAANAFDDMDDQIRADILHVIAYRPDLFEPNTALFIRRRARLVADQAPAWIESERRDRAMDAAEENYKFRRTA